MNKLIFLKSATTLGEVATLLDYKASSLSYILYFKPEHLKYKTFEIPKKYGGTRKISAPTEELKLIQRKLSVLLQDCIEEINTANKFKDSISHGFKRDRSIITNAKRHRNHRYVFNVDLKDFFNSITFPRIYGFLIKDTNFGLHKKIAGIIAHIACFESSLPQGSPCSPVISNMIGHLLDLHLVKLASKNGCIYSRYADDLTFSTNRPDFPSEIARKCTTSNIWIPGNDLNGLVKKSGFEINPKKTRMQYQDSRQEVTGLVVNKKVNIRFEYRRTVRAMVNRLFTKGSFDFEHKFKNSENLEIVNSTPGTLNQLHGMLGFIESIDLYNKLLIARNGGNNAKRNLTSKETMYKRFLFYKEFYTAPKPIIICEGKTDNIYLTHAIRSLAATFPELAEVQANSKIDIKVRLFKYSDTSTGRILNLHGGSGDISRFIRDYNKESVRFLAPGKVNPVIILIDNDSGAEPIFNTIKDLKHVKPKNTDAFIHIFGNLYLVPTPLEGDMKESCIEDFFDQSTKDELIDGKTFNPSNESDSKGTYGKMVFAHKVISAKAQTINFSGFLPLLIQIDKIIHHHKQNIKDVITK